MALLLEITSPKELGDSLSTCPLPAIQKCQWAQNRKHWSTNNNFLFCLSLTGSNSYFYSKAGMLHLLCLFSQCKITHLFWLPRNSHLVFTVSSHWFGLFFFTFSKMVHLSRLRWRVGNQLFINISSFSIYHHLGEVQCICAFCWNYSP